MNKRIFSLVCIALYALLDASIYCSQQKESDARNKNVRGTKEINRSNEKNDIEFKRETQLKNNNTKNDEDDKDDLDDNDYKDETYDSEYTNEDDIYNREYVNNDKIYNREYVNNDKIYNRKCVNNDDVNDGEYDKGYKDETHNLEYANNDKIYNRKCVNNDDVDDGENDKESSCFNIFKSGNKSKRIKENLYSKVPSGLSSDEMIKIFLNNHKDLPTDKLEFEKYIRNIFENDPIQRMFLFILYIKLVKKDVSDD
ncbi:fam-c protein [Plasmodium vinckei brucechwatti]|uniref:Fam-c protein n=1 Tax=Plasmodium vinckei brucechwatti TaxID=119398 RepID=A0A6V7SF60_PLAVN|nr:fam-c protein [Plasmodium vinckei brucechwatti]